MLSAWSRRGAELGVIVAIASLGCTGVLHDTDGFEAGEGTGAGSGKPGSNGSGANAGGSAGSGGGGSSTSEPPPFEPAPGMLRRLTRAQFRNAVREIFGVEVDERELDPDSYNGEFATVGAATIVSSPRAVEQYHAAIERAVDAVFSDAERRAAFVGCTPTDAAGDACVRGFIERLGLRAWRRPLDAAELERLSAVATNASRVLGDVFEGPRWATVGLFTSPNFLYRAELGVPDASGTWRYTGYELAARLSFLLWNNLPDQTLLDEAASGKLNTPEGLRAAAERMLDAPTGRRAIGSFAEEFMRLDRVLGQAKDTGLYPEYGPSLQAAMVRDMRETWEAIAFDDEVSALELFSTRKVVVNSELASLYGLDPAGLGPNTFEVRELPASGQRQGILSKAAFLSQFANQKEGSPTLRGKFIRAALLCTPVSPPPGDVSFELEDAPTDRPLTKRERLELHRSKPACAGCHSLMDPLGLPFENFDAIGRYRTMDNGLPVDASGEFEGQPVANASEFGLAIGASREVAECLVRQYYTYAVGHVERDVDRSVVDALFSAFESSGFKLRDLVLDVVTSEAFSVTAPQPDLN